MTDRTRTLGVAGLGAGLLAAVYGWHEVADLGVDSGRFLVLGAAVLAACAGATALLWRGARRRDLIVVLGVALAARALLAFDMPTLSDDVYRFVWDGRVQAEGINPYDFAPTAPELDGLRDFEVFSQLNRPLIRSAYPPANQLVFVAVNVAAGEGVSEIKVAFLLAEALTLGLLLLVLARAGVPRGRVALYAWHPLAISEISHAGHPEPLLMALTLLALLAWSARRPVGAGLALGAAVLTKLVPVLLGPFMLRRLGWRFAAAGVTGALVLFAPYAGAGIRALGSLGDYGDERYGSGPYHWLTSAGLGHGRAQVLLGLALVAGVAWSAWRPPGDLAGACRVSALLLGGAVVASFNVQPWYLLWALPLLCVAPVPGLIWACATVPLYYGAIAPDPFISEDATSAIVWGPTVALLAAQVLRERRAPRSAAGQPPVPVPSGTD